MQACVHAVLMLENGDRTNHVIDPFARDETTELQDIERVRIPAEIRASVSTVDGPEFVGIESARDHRDLAFVGVIETLHVDPVLRTFGDDAIGFADQPRFDFETRVGETVGLALVLSAHEPERMKRDHQRNVELAAHVE